MRGVSFAVVLQDYSIISYTICISETLIPVNDLPTIEGGIGIKLRPWSTLSVTQTGPLGHNFQHLYDFSDIHDHRVHYSVAQLAVECAKEKCMYTSGYHNIPACILRAQPRIYQKSSKIFQTTSILYIPAFYRCQYLACQALTKSSNLLRQQF